MSIYFTDKEKALANSLNEELIEDINKQEFVLYKINFEASDSNIYGESPNKVFEPGISIWGMITLTDIEATTSAARGVSQIRKINIAIQKQQLIDNSFYFDEGDYVYWDSQYFEVKSIKRPQKVQGLPAHDWSFILDCESIGISELTITDRDKYDD